jgi:hypothetical protein
MRFGFRHEAFDAGAVLNKGSRDGRATPKDDEHENAHVPIRPCSSVWIESRDDSHEQEEAYYDTDREALLPAGGLRSWRRSSGGGEGRGQRSARRRHSDVRAHVAS